MRYKRKLKNIYIDHQNKTKQPKQNQRKKNKFDNTREIKKKVREGKK